MLEKQNDKQCMTERQLIYSAWKTPDGTILHSRHRHDYCEHFDAVSKEWYILDGGSDYQRCSINTVPPEDLTLYADDPHEKIREVFVWKSYGKNFSQPEGVYTLLKDLTDEHIIAICETQTHLPEYILEMFENEQLFRKETNANNPRLA